MTDIVEALRAAGCVFAEDEARILLAAADDGADLNALLRRRIGGEPLEHIVQQAQFCGRTVIVVPGVFVPRVRTGHLVRCAADLARARAREDHRLVLVDLCCGTGAIGAALVDSLDGAALDLHAADIDPAAVACARRNLSDVGGKVYQGDLFAALPDALRGRIDVLAANVPYVPTDAIALMPPEARLHEPRTALDGGDDGLQVFGRVSAAAAAWLAPGGHLLVETSEGQVDTATATLARDGLSAQVRTCDEVGSTVVIGTRS